MRDEPRPGERRRTRHVEWLLFVASLLAFAWFHPGGGWNQNARFALVRALVEEGRVAVDSFLVYDADPRPGAARLVRSAVVDGEVHRRGERLALYWRDGAGRAIPLARRVAGQVVAVRPSDATLEVSVAEGPTFEIRVPPGAQVLRDGHPAPLASFVGGELVLVSLAAPDGRRALAQRVDAGVASTPVTWVEPGAVASSGDLSFNDGHFHPAKAPGGSFLAVPAYAAVRAVGRIAGADPDDWWTLTLGAWLTSVFSVGLLAAASVVLLFRLAMRLSGGRATASTLAALTFAFGTPFFPYATMLYEHAAIAFFLLLAFALLLGAQERPGEDGFTSRGAFAAGVMAGFAAASNYVMAVVALLLLAYLLATIRRARPGLAYLLGLLGPFLLLCAYNVAAFGTPFTTNYAFEDPQFLEKGEAFLGVFQVPDLSVILQATVSPFRGVFLAAPALLLGVAGLVTWFRSGRMRAEWVFVVSVVGFFLAFLTTFNGWHGGWGASPRYLVPALPFLALPAVLLFARAPVVSSAVAAISIVLNLLVVAVDPQAPVGLTPMARIDGLPTWRHSPVTLYEWPLFSTGRAGPILDAQREAVLEANDRFLARKGAPPEARARSAAGLRRHIDQTVAEGQPAPLLLQRGPDGAPGLSPSPLSAFTGPVSANPAGMYEGWMFQTFGPGSNEARWNSFNVGEFLFPQSRWSLAPLLLLELLLCGLAVRAARRLDAGTA